MRSVRAYLYRTKEFLYPDDKSYTARSTFWGVVQGMQDRGERFEINWGSALFDNNGVEIFEKDIIVVYSFSKKTNRVTGEKAEVVYEGGCYNAVNQMGLDVDLGSCIHEDGAHFVTVENNVYNLVKRP